MQDFTFPSKVVILVVWRLSGGPNKWAGGQSYPLGPLRAGHTVHILLIFFKIPRIYSNMLEYTQICLNILKYFLIGWA
jgi:hypothetical protein